MQKVGVAAGDGFRNEREAGLGAIDQAAIIGAAAQAFAGNAVAAVEDIAVDRGLVGDAEARVRFAPVERAVVVDHQRIHHRIGVAHAVGQHGDAAGLAQRVEVAAQTVKRIGRGFRAPGFEHHVGGDQPRGSRRP